VRYAANAGTGASKRIVFQFLTSPIELLGHGQVEAVRTVGNRLERDAHGRQRAVATHNEEVIPAGLVLRSIGYRGTPLDGLPFDHRLGVIPHEDGRVSGRPGAYVAGWIKRGPTGIIGTNKKCARDTVRSLLADAAAGRLPTGGTLDRDTVGVAIHSRQPKTVCYQAWEAIDRHERRAGAAAGRPRVKLAKVPELLAAAAPTASQST
jgi:ferredoxin--NADP+ reductase